ncbi:P-loop containing nucleoside triphosphate hydrolase protein [Fimicolochytrium jonesii]|uniref:P-loop containing nucleoside triphosphate hydrolase protein n=1 Tax=Fimicolochytrium jonesii TaxID=1396493 RepID=UPI0022FE9DDB|nr:P-loop containing nucleoside triphosphate hydrolase protein [Fimicolochytrium jonesii]KAI8825225.1 P-loop containing nucleoside triphosphate hydrolase protein [Fimicolochytrium jonesii]
MGPRRGEIEPLAPTDHSVITYEEINKDFYEEHEDIKRLSDADVERVRRELDMHVRGVGVAKPCISFAHFGFDDALVNVVRKLGYTEPTGIQRQAVPVALSGRDMIGIAKTGSGKTAAFVWPMLVHIMDQRELEKGEGPIGLILAPTRELAHQIYIETKKYAKAYGLNCACVYGGASKSDQFKDLRSPVEILVATPGRLLDLIKMKATNLRRVSYLVLDEADRMFDLGFEPQVRSLCTAVRPDRQTLLFSATMRKRVERLARDVLTDPVRISIGAQNAANADITQHIHVLPDDTYKWAWLTSHLPAFTAEGSVLVFIGRKAGVDALTDSLQGARVECAKLHGDMMQADRDRVVREFKAGKFKLLVCTDVAARGLDIKSVRTVINYDAPKDIETHIHRIGRTGRAGTKGDAHTLITQSEDRFAAELVRNLEESGVAVQSDVMGVAMRNGRFRKGREGFARGGRGRGRGGGRGRGRGRGVGFGQGGGSGGGANSVPLGGGGFARHPPPPSLGAPGGGYSRQPPPPTSYGAGTGFMAFQRAQSAQGSSTSFLGGTAQQQQPPPQRPPQQQPPQQPEQQRRRRWDT